MPFVKIDCGVLESSLWPDRDLRDVFLTALFMAEPIELRKPTPQLRADSLVETGWVIPAGWYGIVRAAGVGILTRAGIEREAGLAKLHELGEPDPDSRSQAFEGRRLIRIDGGYIVLNYDAYRQRDYTAAERSKRWRDRKAKRDERDATRNDTQAEAEAEGEAEREPDTESAPAARESVESPEERPRGDPVRKPEGVDVQTWSDWLRIRRAKHAALTQTAMKVLAREAQKAGKTVPEALTICVERGWAGFQASWLLPGAVPGRQSKPVAHIPNMPLGASGCGCAECVAFRNKKGASA